MNDIKELEIEINKELSELQNMLESCDAFERAKGVSNALTKVNYIFCEFKNQQESII